MSETQDSQIRNTIPDNIAKPLSNRFVRIFKNSLDNLYYGKKFDGSIELIGGPNAVGKVFIQGGDTTLGYLLDKISAGTGISFNVVDLGGGNLSLEISSTGGSNMQQTIKTGYILNVPGSTSNIFIPIFQYTGRISVIRTQFFNTSMPGNPDGNYQGTGIAVNDDLVNPANIVTGSTTTLDLQFVLQGHLMRSAGFGNVFPQSPVVSDNVVAANTALAQGTLESKDGGNSYIGMYIGTNNSTLPYAGVYDVVIDWEPLSPGATLIAL